MKHVVRLFYALLMFSCIYGVSLYVIPRLDFMRSLRAEWTWLGPGSITQVLFLVFSLILMLILGKGDLSRYGFRTAPLRATARAALTGLGASAVIFLVGMGLMSLIFGPGPESGGDGPGPSHDLVKTILFVWILASTCEEVFYRGLLQNFLSPLGKYGFRLLRWRISVPVALCALAFGLGHLCLIGMMPGPLVAQIVVSATVLGIIAGYFLEKTGSLVPAIIVHASFNVVGMVIPIILTAVL
jgi:membrane protease YdiL (CAAX protease family)